MITTFKRFLETTAYGAGHHEDGKAKDKGIIALMSSWDMPKIIETYFELFGHSPNTEDIDTVKKELRTKFISMRRSGELQAIKKYFTDIPDDHNFIKTLYDSIEEGVNDKQLIETIESDIEDIANNICSKLNGTVESDWPDSDIENPFDPSIWIEVHIPTITYKELLSVFTEEVSNYSWSDLVTPEILGGSNDDLWSLSIGLTFMSRDPRGQY